MTPYQQFKELAVNKHYFNKYINFIIHYQNRITKTKYLENHHIIPRSLFVEYEDLKQCPWNGIKLTAREHIIAHIMLHFAFKGSMSVALYFMLGRFNSETNSSLYGRKVSFFHKVKYLIAIKE